LVCCLNELNPASLLERLWYRLSHAFSSFSLDLCIFHQAGYPLLFLVLFFFIMRNGVPPRLAMYCALRRDESPLSPQTSPISPSIRLSNGMRSGESCRVALVISMEYMGFSGPLISIAAWIFLKSRFLVFFLVLRQYQGE